MPLDAAKASAKTAAIAEAFAAIGHADETRMPRSKSNSEPAAWEYHVASQLARLAEARKKKAHAAAVAAGVLFDHEKQPKPSGTSETVYTGDVVEIAVSVANAASRFDAPAFIDALEKTGIARRTLDKLAVVHTHENRAPHKFTSALVTG